MSLLKRIYFPKHCLWGLRNDLLNCFFKIKAVQNVILQSPQAVFGKIDAFSLGVMIVVGR